MVDLNMLKNVLFKKCRFLPLKSTCLRILLFALFFLSHIVTGDTIKFAHIRRERERQAAAAFS